jgi:hypothetical protein
VAGSATASFDAQAVKDGPPAAFLPLTKEIYDELAASIEFTLSALRKPETLIIF